MRESCYGARVLGGPDRGWGARLSEALLGCDRPPTPSDSARRVESQIVRLREDDEECADAFGMETSITLPYGPDVAERMSGADPALTDAEKLGALVSCMTDPRNMKATLRWLGEREIDALRWLLFEQGGRFPLGGSDARGRALVPIRGWCYLVEHDGARFEIVATSQAMRVARKLDWGRLAEEGRDRDRLLGLAGVLTWCFGVIEKSEMWKMYEEAYPGSSLELKYVGLCLVHAAYRGRTRARIVSDPSHGRSYVAHDDLLLLAHESDDYHAELTPLNNQLVELVEECLENRAEGVSGIAASFENPEGLYMHLTGLPAVEHLRHCLLRQAPDAANPEPWLTQALAMAVRTARYADSAVDVAEVLENCFPGFMGAADGETIESLSELLGSMPRWGCRLKADDIDPSFPIEPIEYVPASFRFARK